MLPLSAYYQSVKQSLPARERIAAWMGTTRQFGSWQFVSQGLQLFTGFLLIRWLSYESYAQFGLALSFQNMLGQLVDFGFSSAILALVGERVGEREVVGRYLRSASSQRTRLLVILAPLSGVAFFWFVHAHAWPALTGLLLFVSIVALLFFQGWSSIYSQPLLMHQQLARLYRPQVGLNAGKLALCYLLKTLSGLGAASICWINVLATAAIGWLYRSAARPFFTEPESVDRETNREFRRYLAPLIFGMLFYAFHGQIQMFLISTFGNNQSIAEVAALGRIGQLLVFGSAFTSTLLVPYMARVPLHTLARRYIQALTGILLFCLSLSLAAYLFPNIFLLLLGAKYSSLHSELVLAVGASSVSFVTSTLYAFNNARKWTNHASAIAGVTGVIAIDLVLIRVLNLGITRNVLILSFLTNAFPILPFACAAVLGYRRDLSEPGDTAVALPGLCSPAKAADCGS
jgi:O-antigen/teichoic acid export membrane protein